MNTKTVLAQTVLTFAVGLTASAQAELQIHYHSSSVDAQAVGVETCETIVESDPQATDGVYVINPTGSDPFEAYCDMETDGGGWTMVAAQFQETPVTSWTKAVDESYDPSLASGVSFALPNDKIPDHTQMAAGRDLDPTRIDYWDFQYDTGPIDETLITGKRTGNDYTIYRGWSSYYSSHDPERSFRDFSSEWDRTLTIDIEGDRHTWAFAPQHDDPTYRGYAMDGVKLVGEDNEFAWTVWVR